MSDEELMWNNIGTMGADELAPYLPEGFSIHGDWPERQILVGGHLAVCGFLVQSNAWAAPFWTQGLSDAVKAEITRRLVAAHDRYQDKLRQRPKRIAAFLGLDDAAQ